MYFNQENTVNVHVTSVTVSSDYDIAEVIAVDIADSSGCLPYRIVGAYRPPDYSKEQNELFFSALNYLANGSARLCIIGDFNLPDFNWDLFYYPNSHLYTTAADFVTTHGLSQLVDFPTRGSNILDLVLCSDVLCCDDFELLPPIGSSDHDIIYFKLALSLPSFDCPSSDVKLFNFAKAD